MNRFLKFGLIASVLAIGTWLLANRSQINSVADAVSLASDQISSFQSSATIDKSSWKFASSPVNNGRIRVASFNMHNYGKAKGGRGHVLEHYAKIIKQFDVIALQEIRTQDTNMVTRLLDTVNQADGRFAILISPHVGRNHLKEQYAFIYNTQTIQPLGSPYNVSDPDGMLHREPFVGWFGTRAVDPKRAFTFSLVNFHLDEDNLQAERQLIPSLVKAIRNDGRFEDDVIMLGDLKSDDLELKPVLVGSNLNWLIRERTTDTLSKVQSDNIIVNSLASVEFTGRCGVYDFMRQFNLTLPQALEVSDHMPVWAEFSTEEGQASGAVAVGAAGTLR